MRCILPAAVAGLLLVSVPLQAHHAAAAVYDSNKPITFTGKVTKVARRISSSALAGERTRSSRETQLPSKALWRRMDRIMSMDAV